MWTVFTDSHSGGRSKLDNYEIIYIEAPRDEAEIIFYNKFNNNPLNITCDCCGKDFGIDEYNTLLEATKGYFVKTRNVPVEELLEKYLKSDGIFVIYATDIKSEDKKGCLPNDDPYEYDDNYYYYPEGYY